MPTLVLHDVPSPLYDQIQRLAEARKRTPSDTVLEVLETAFQIVAAPAPSEAPPTPEAGSSASSGRGKRMLVIAAALLLVLVPLGWLFGDAILAFAANQGDLVIEVDDPDIEIKIAQNGVVVRDRTSMREFVLTAGTGEIHLLDKDGVMLAARHFELTRGGKTKVKLTLQELADARKVQDPDPQRDAKKK